MFLLLDIGKNTEYTKPVFKEKKEILKKEVIFVLYSIILVRLELFLDLDGSISRSILC